MDPYLGGSWTMIPSIPTHSNLVENLADAIDNGSRDQHSDALTVEGQKKKLEESEQLLNQRRDLIAKYRSSVEDLLKTEP
ncbi:mediator of RNA polymerase II transcription subunit 9 isoform X2 [Gossypium australe]|uniref:Mediator of RNA polymerase II transcription subunit 9 isoform X2 n=1 Tax=Gossypium australe TaxID=47621 RepID=A0A5B6X5W7_9ROSI|nr:mediator of RNA polymerase II transcription subunit 9 isoform X2 [Gossypium australe]